MMLSSSFLALAAATVVHGHFTFIRLAHNGVWAEPLQYIRNKTAPFDEPYTPNTNVNTRGYHFPTYNTDLIESVRCGRDNMAYAASTETLTVKAGDTLEIAHSSRELDSWTDDHFYGCPDDRGTCPRQNSGPRDNVIIHDGPVLIHLSSVPEGQTIEEYDGSGEWTKIWTLGVEWRPEDDPKVYWLAKNNEQLPPHMIFQIPPQTPAGAYLLRMDLIYPGVITEFGVGGPQLYPTCAHIVVESNVTGSLPEGIKIPEDVQNDSPGILLSAAMYRDEKIDEDFVYPGGKLWTGEELIVDRPDI